MPGVDAAAFAWNRRAVRVIFGAGASDDAAAELQRAEFIRPFLLSTSGRSTDVDRVASGLPDVAGRFARAELHVPAALVTEARDAALRAHAGSLVAIGGGSAIGLGKAIAQATGLSLAALPTTYSGSEMTDIWGVTDEHGKRTAREPRAAPRLVIYDPALTLTLPAAATAASAMNAAAHAVEALYAHDASPMPSLAAEAALRALADALPAVLQHGNDLTARTTLLRAAFLAGIALDQTSMGLQHRLAHVLGGTFGLPHAETHAALLPHVVAFNESSAPAAMSAIARALGATSAAAGVRALAHAIGVTYTLRDLGLRDADLDRAAELATRNPPPNPRPPVRSEVLELLRDAL
jgi:maleylacetate reductase